MMQAETVYSVFQALSPEEQQRFHSLFHGEVVAVPLSPPSSKRIDMGRLEIVNRINELETGARSLREQTEALLNLASALKKELSGGSDSSALSQSQIREIIEKRRSHIKKTGPR